MTSLKSDKTSVSVQGPDHDGYLMRFADGPMSKRGNIGTMESKMTVALGNTVVDHEVWSWPLPDRLCVLAHEGEENVAMWPEGDPGDLPTLLTESPNVVIYMKVSESQITDEQAVRMTHVTRGAEYRLVTG